jgi:hypothetical protein
MQREYLTTFLAADARQEEPFLLQMKSWKSGIPPYTPEALIPRLNALGDDGWEIVHMQPVKVGDNADVLVADGGSSTRMWASSYFCVFKRPKAE